MTWNASRPADSDTIRISANLIRNNFQAIQAGNVGLTTITLAQQAALPGSASSARLYGYFNANSGTTELAAVNPNGAPGTVRLTEGGRIGSIGQNAIFGSVQAANLTFDNTYFYTGSLMITARGSVASNGSISMNVNMSASRTGTGKYTLTIPAGVLTVSSYQVFIQPLYNGSQDSVFVDIATKPAVNPAIATVITLEMIYRSDGSKKDSPFEVMIIGGRP